MWAAEAQIDQSWSHTSALLAMLANVNRDPKKGRPFRPSDFHPTQKAAGTKVPSLKGNVAMLKAVFVDSQEAHP